MTARTRIFSESELEIRASGATRVGYESGHGCGEEGTSASLTMVDRRFLGTVMNI
jgi:hypothetical protein